MKTQLRYYFVLFCTLACYVTGHSQINYSQNFEGTVEASWEDYDFYVSDYLPCSGTNSLEAEAANYVDFGFAFDAEVVSPSLGTSNGMPVTFNYAYKILNYEDDAALSNTPDWGSFIWEYATSAAGPWTAFQTLSPANHVVSASCAPKTATFTPPGGSQVYVRLRSQVNTSSDLDFFIEVDNIVVTQAAAAGCSGTPAASVTVAASANVCNQQNASLSLSPFYTATGLTFQWQKSTDGTNYTNITGATSATLSTPQTVNTWYKAIVTCTASTLSVTSTPVQVLNTGLNCMCDVVFSNNVEPITNVTFATINNTTSATVNGTPAVQNFSNLTPPVVYKGVTYPISLQGNTDGGSFTTFFKVFVDFNQNGNLDETGESFNAGSVTGSTGVDGQVATGSIAIPATALTGVTYMRVIKLYSSATDGYPTTACPTAGQYGYGQVEDYLINIQPCTTVAPTAAATQTFCANSTIANLAATGTNVKWYAAASGGSALSSGIALTNGTTYYASQTNGCESIARTAVTVTITVVPADDPADVTNCGPYVLPVLTNGVYRTAAAGGGNVVAAGTSITATTTLYVYATAGTCSVDNSFVITITNVVADDPADVINCGPYVLPVLTNGVYRTATAGGGTVVAPGTAITATTTLYVYAGTAPCTAENSFTIIINNAVADDPADVSVCGSYTLPALTNGAYYTQSGGLGDMLAAGSSVNADTTLYVYSAVGTCTAENSFTVTITAFEVDDPTDVSACSEYVLPELTNGAYYSGGSGLGTMFEAGDVITETTTLHVYGVSSDNPACSDDNAFTITIISVVADELNDVDTCSEYILPALSAGNSYYTGPGGTGTMLNAGDEIDETMTIYVHAQSGSALVCTDETSFTVTVTEIEEPIVEEEIIFEADGTEPLLLDDIEVEADGTITWYASEEDAENGVNALSSPYAIPLGVSTYYVTQTIGECESDPAEVTVTVVLDTKTFDMAAFSYYPNPVSDVLNLGYSENITGVEVYNLVGQKVMSGQYNNSNVQLNLSQLASGTYMVRVSTENASKTIKVVKNK